MKAINKLNESLKYRIHINNRNVVAAICVQELDNLKNHTSSFNDRELIDKMIMLSERELYSQIPMKLLPVNSIMSVHRMRSRACKMQPCSKSCTPSDGSITIAKLAPETMELIMAGIEDNNTSTTPAVTPHLTVFWKNVRTGAISTSNNIVAEYGDMYEWTGAYTWYSQPGYSKPYKMESNIFDTFVDEGVLSDTKTMTINSEHTFNVTFTSLSGDKSEATSTLDYQYPVYYGIVGKTLNKALSDTYQYTITVTTNEDEYFVYKYPIELPKLESIIMNNAFDVMQAFVYSEESFTTDTGLNTTLRVYTSANPGAFTNTKLSFK